MRNIGLHLRILESFNLLIKRAINLKLPVFQCFFTGQNNFKYIELSKSLINNFLKLRDKFGSIYAHGSYLINLADKNSSHPLLKKEIYYAKALEFTHLVYHPGSSINGDKLKSIDNIASLLNKVLKQEQNITILLENIAYSGKSIGGNIEDLFLIRSKVNFPERVKFCIDTAHAYAYGYNLADQLKVKKFIKNLILILGQDAVELIHLNNTSQTLGSKLDSHAVLNTGNIDIDNLKSFVSDPELSKISVILELPLLKETEEVKQLNLVRNWFR